MEKHFGALGIFLKQERKNRKTKGKEERNNKNKEDRIFFFVITMCADVLVIVAWWSRCHV